MAYGTNAPFGLKPYRYANGSAWNAQTTSYPIASGYATSMFTGDPVTTLADGTIGIGVAGSAIRGVFTGCKYTNALGQFVHSAFWPASTTLAPGTTAEALVIDDPNLVWTIQEADGAGAAGTPLVPADVGLNANFRVGTGSTATGLSGVTINNTSEATTATLNLKILGLDPTPENRVGAFANWLVVINNHQLQGGTGTLGV
jgi:hypothetical protein